MSMNWFRGVTTNRDFVDVDETEIADCMADKDIMKARKINKTVGGTRRSTASVILDFNAGMFPETVHVGNKSILVRPYIPKVLVVSIANYTIIMEKLLVLLVLKER